MIDTVSLSEILFDGAKEVFETMVFMDMEKSDDPGEKPQGDLLLSSITFTGDAEGCFAICSSDDCAKAIAANMLGLETSEEISSDDISDAIGEVANMVMGSIKALLMDKVANINVSIPSVVRGQQLENCLGEGAQKISVMVNLQDEFTAELLLLYREASK